MYLKISLNISTYKESEQLSRVLATVARQTRLPEETLVLEDAEWGATESVVESFKQRIPGLRLIQQEDRGFRLARLRNLGLLNSSGSYIVSIDGDMLLHPRFIEDHAKAAQRGFFVQGVRQLLSPKLSRALVDAARVPQGFECVVGRETGNKWRWWGIRACWLSCLFSRDYSTCRKVTGSNQAFFREDLFRVNGYDNSFRGWGEEDQDLAGRLMHSGLRERHLRYAAVAWHLYHPPRPRENHQNTFLGEDRDFHGVRALAEELKHVGPPLSHSYVTV
ncbi:MAG: glycosyltransferase [Coraliomargarita sp.]